jgi:hypothetical protein
MLRLAAPLLLALLMPFTAAAEALYAPTPISSSARISDFGSTTGFGFRSFDNFTVATGGTVDRVAWRGFWIDFGNPSPAPAPGPDVLTWTIAFHASGGGTPGAQLASESFAAAAVTSTLLGTSVFNANGTFNVSQYAYSIDLPTPFVADAGVEYWVSVLSLSDLYDPAFALLGATGGDDSSFQQQLGAGMSVVGDATRAADRAIFLDGTLRAVPEPTTLSLAFAGLALLGLRRARPLVRASGFRR